MKKIFYLVMLLSLTNCADKTDTKRDCFINGNDYWAHYDEAVPGFQGIYYRFTEEGKVIRYCKNDTLNKLKPCLVLDDLDLTNIPWEVSNDSILKWGLVEYNIITCNKSVIVLYAKGEKRRHKFLIKEYPNELRKGKRYYTNRELK